MAGPSLPRLWLRKSRSGPGYELLLDERGASKSLADGLGALVLGRFFIDGPRQLGEHIGPKVAPLTDLFRPLLAAAMGAKRP